MDGKAKVGCGVVWDGIGMEWYNMAYHGMVSYRMVCPRRGMRWYGRVW